MNRLRPNQLHGFNAAITRYYSLDRFSGCPATWKTWKCQAILMKGESQGSFKKQENSEKSQGIFIFSQSEHPNFETFLEKLLIIVWKKSGKFDPSGGWTPWSSSYLTTSLQADQNN